MLMVISRAGLLFFSVVVILAYFELDEGGAKPVGEFSLGSFIGDWRSESSMSVLSIFNTCTYIHTYYLHQ